MSNQNPIFSFAASQNITPSLPDSLYNQTTSAEDLAALFNTNIPEELPQIDEEKAKKLEIDEEYVQSLSAVLANLVSTIPDFPQPQFIPLKHLHDDINVQAEIDKMIKKKHTPRITTTNSATTTTTTAFPASSSIQPSSLVSITTTTTLLLLRVPVSVSSRRCYSQRAASLSPLSLMANASEYFFRNISFKCSRSSSALIKTFLSLLHTI